MKVYVLIHRCETPDCGNGADCVGVFTNRHAAIQTLIGEYIDNKPKDEYCEYWTDPDEKDKNGTYSFYLELDGEYNEWHIEEHEVKENQS